MPVALERLKEELLRLPDEDRLELARILWDSLELPEDECSEYDAAWIKELDRRRADFESGRETGEPFEKVFAELYAEAWEERESEKRGDQK